MEIVAQRVFNPLYVWLDVCFLVFFCAMLLIRRRYMTLLFALFGGVLYFAVDYGLFHLALHARSIEGGSLFWVLLWMSMSYGITNFAWIWLWLSKDKRLKEWTILIAVWWIAAPMLAATFGRSLPPITIQRTTDSYHGYMALLLFVGYAGLVCWNLFEKNPERRFRLLWLLAVGVLVQFGWEFSLLVGGIRSAGFESYGDKLMTLVVNSLVETNMGIPYIYAIFLGFTSKYTEDLKRRENPLKFFDRLVENNRETVRERAAKSQTVSK